ncbi:MAG: cupin domain-containing protein [Actinomycetota bacterium]|nr:cupin domain-containing protein [Actinomycetota bacterium]
MAQAKRTHRDTCTRIIGPDTEDETILFPGAAIYITRHHAGQVEDLHTHEEDHVLVMRSGRMRWTVGEETVEAVPGMVIVAPAGVRHSFQVLGPEEARLVCIESPNPEL